LYDIIGSIAVLDKKNVSSSLIKKILLAHKQVKSIYYYSKTSGVFRTKKLKHIYGEKNTLTIHKENKMLFLLDLKKVFFSPRLSFERMRIAKQITKPQKIMVLFAGVGPFAICISKYSKAKEIVGVELNKTACEFFKKNISLNKCKNILVINCNVNDLVKQKKFFSWADRVVMPRPYGRKTFLDVGVFCVKNGGIIHYYDFENISNWEQKILKKIENNLKKLNVNFSILNKKIVRKIGKNFVNVVFDIKITKH
jgi:tRNA (guanine37-N1)-methyltransferase